MAWTKASAKKAQETKARNRALLEQGLVVAAPSAPKATNGALAETITMLAEKAVAAKNEPVALRLLGMLDRLL